MREIWVVMIECSRNVNLFLDKNLNSLERPMSNSIFTHKQNINIFCGKIV
jgi:hypothetical protein